MNRKILAAIIITIVLLAIPGTLLITHGNLIPPEQTPYVLTSMIDDIQVDDAFTTQLIMGVQKAVYQLEKNDIKVEQHVLLYKDPSFIELLQDVSPKSNLVLTTSSDLPDLILQEAREHPQTSYLSVDLSYGNETLPKNVQNLVFRSNEASFVAGYVAGKITETGKIGFLAGMDIPAIDSFYYGFRAGIDVAAIERNMTIDLVRKTANTFQDDALGYNLTKEMYLDGCDICFMVAGQTGVGGMTAAEELKKYIIGVDSDQAYLAPGYVIFSVVKNIKDVITNSIYEQATNKTLIQGGEVSLGYKEGGVGIVSYLKTVIPLDVEKRAQIWEQLITDIWIIVPHDAESYAKFDAEQDARIIEYVLS